MKINKKNIFARYYNILVNADGNGWTKNFCDYFWITTLGLFLLPGVLLTKLFSKFTPIEFKETDSTNDRILIYFLMEFGFMVLILMTFVSKIRGEGWISAIILWSIIGFILTAVLVGIACSKIDNFETTLTTKTKGAHKIVTVPLRVVCKGGNVIWNTITDFFRMCRDKFKAYKEKKCPIIEWDEEVDIDLE